MLVGVVGFGLGGEIRTPDPFTPNEMRYQTALHRDSFPTSLSTNIELNSNRLHYTPFLS